MFKAIFVFIKAHIIGTAIVTTVVVGSTVTGAVVISHNTLDKEVKEHLDILVSSNFQVDTDSANVETQTTPENTEASENTGTTEKSDTSANYDKPLTFRIEKISTGTNGSLTEGSQGNNADSGNGTSYRIIPSYDKDYSKWTDAEKREYQKMHNRIAELAKEDYNNAVENEAKAMENAMLNLEKIQNSFSKEYMFTFTKDGYLIESENWSYNSYLKLYTGNAYDYQYIESLYKDVMIDGIQQSGVTKQDFRNIAYTNLKQKIENTVQLKLQRQKKDNPAMFENAQALKEFKDELNQDKQEQLSKLEELYHLSD